MSKKYERKDWHNSPDKKHRLGALGEDKAALYVSNVLGMTVIERNVRFSMGEIDIVAIDGRSLCIIEVKTRSSLKYGRPSLALTKEKQRKLRTLTQMYMRTRRQYSSYSPRIDVAEIIYENEKYYINYIKAAC